MGCISAAGGWRVVHVVVDIAGNKEIQLSVTVIVTEARAVGPVAEGHPGLLRDVGERPVMVVVKEAVLPKLLTYRSGQPSLS